MREDQRSSSLNHTLLHPVYDNQHKTKLQLILLLFPLKTKNRFSQHSMQTRDQGSSPYGEEGWSRHGWQEISTLLGLDLIKAGLDTCMWGHERTRALRQVHWPVILLHRKASSLLIRMSLNIIDTLTSSCPVQHHTTPHHTDCSHKPQDPCSINYFHLGYLEGSESFSFILVYVL